MFNLGFTEILVLAVIGLIVLGPDQLPQMARKIARMLNQFKQATEEAMSPVNDLKKDAQNMIEKQRKEMEFNLEEEPFTPRDPHADEEPKKDE